MRLLIEVVGKCVCVCVRRRLRRVGLHILYRVTGIQRRIGKRNATNTFFSNDNFFFFTVIKHIQFHIRYEYEK